LRKKDSMRYLLYYFLSCLKKPALVDRSGLFSWVSID
jgi:hypothetical protein